MKKFSIVMLFFALNVLGMEDSAMQYIKMKAEYTGYTEIEIGHREKLEEFAKNSPDIVFDRFYDIFASSAIHLPLCHTFALLSALGHICSSNDVDTYVVNRICKHVAYLRASKNVKCHDVQKLIDVADEIISYIPYAGLCVYNPTKPCLPSETKQKTYKFVIDWLKEKKYKNGAVIALLQFMSTISQELWRDSL